MGIHKGVRMDPYPIISRLKFQQECTVFHLGPIERRVRRVNGSLYQIYDIHHMAKRAWHVSFENGDYLASRVAMNVKPSFLDGWKITDGPRAIGYQSKQNRKIEKRIFWNHSQKYNHAQLVVIQGGKSAVVA